MQGLTRTSTAASWWRIGPTQQLKAAGDLGCWVVSVLLSWALIADLQVSALRWRSALAILLAVAAGQLGLGMATGLYRGVRRFASYDEVWLLAITTVLTGAIAMAANGLASPSRVPRPVPPVATMVALLFSAALRVAWRHQHQRSRARQRAATQLRAVVVGTGNAAQQIMPSLLRSPKSPYLPVALLDDDPAKRRFRLDGVRVLGTTHDLAAVAQHTHADVVIVAVPSAPPSMKRRVFEAAEAAGLDVLVLPAVEELLGRVFLSDLRPVEPGDLLGRDEVDLDLSDVADYVRGKTVLVTGAGGSIGSELCRQLASLGPRDLLMLDRDESALHAVQLSIDGHGLLDSPSLLLVDIRDVGALRQAFEQWRPDVVFHAAALKHLPLLERNPIEAWKSNVVGTANVLDAARRTGVSRVVNISTDKAADPASVLGASKRIAERLTAGYARITGRPYVSVRFGNVLGSRGSVLHAFHAQIAAGGPVTVTHPDVTRFFMTVQEAVRLTIRAGAIGAGGEVLVLDMGTPVRIAEVAERLIARAGQPVDIVYTGLRPGEKLHEALLGDDEPDQRPHHPRISHVVAPPLSTEVLGRALDPGLPTDSVRQLLLSLATTYGGDQRRERVAE